MNPLVVSRTFLAKTVAPLASSYPKRIFLLITAFAWCNKVRVNCHDSCLRANMEVL